MLVLVETTVSVNWKRRAIPSSPVICVTMRASSPSGEWRSNQRPDEMDAPSGLGSRGGTSSRFDVASPARQVDFVVDRSYLTVTGVPGLLFASNGVYLNSIAVKFRLTDSAGLSPPLDTEYPEIKVFVRV